MATRTLVVPAPLDDVWQELQRLETWEGLGGLKDLHDGKWTDAGTLKQFKLTIETVIGTINDRADCTANKPRLTARAAAKGISIEVDLVCSEVADGTSIDFTIDGRSTSFMTKALERPLRAVFDNNIDDERDKLAERLNQNICS